MRDTAAVTLRERVTADGRRRVFTELTAVLARRYQDAVVVAAPLIEPRLGEGVCAGRLRGRGPRPLAEERAAWDARLRAIDPGSLAAVGDVRDCFGSIRRDAVALALADAGVDPTEVVSVLDACAAAGTRGLPVGPWPSVIVANLVLAAADRSAAGAGARVHRWVDDVVLVADDRARTTRALDAWIAGLAACGLAAHEGKTAIVTVGELRASRWASSDVACYARREDPLSSRSRPHLGPPSSR